MLDLSPETLPAPYAGLNLGEELGRALVTAGCQVERTCTTEECAHGKTPPGDVHILSFDLRYDRQQFACSISLEVRDRPGGRVEYREKASSPVCPAAEALEDTRRAARVACDELRKSLARAGDPSGSNPAGSGTGGSTGGSTTTRASDLPPSGLKLQDSSPRFADRPADFTPGRVLTAAVVAAGAAALAGGALLLYLDGNPTSCARSPDGERVCTRTRQTGVAAVPLLLVGAAGVGWGTWKLLPLHPM